MRRACLTSPPTGAGAAGSLLWPPVRLESESALGATCEPTLSSASEESGAALEEWFTTGVARRTSPRAGFLGCATAGGAGAGAIELSLRFLVEDGAGTLEVVEAALAGCEDAGAGEGATVFAEMAGAVISGGALTGDDEEGDAKFVGCDVATAFGACDPSKPERALPGCLEYQKPPAASAMVAAAKPRNNPFLEPEEVDADSEEESESSWPPNMAG